MQGDLLEKKPGAITGFSPKIIFVKMIHRVGHFHPDSKMFNISKFRPKFNDSLNDAIAKIDQYILTIASCSTYEHFDIDSNLSAKGKRSFWLELDDLIDRFERNKVKLLPNPKHVPKTKAHQHGQLLHFNKHYY